MTTFAEPVPPDQLNVDPVWNVVSPPRFRLPLVRLTVAPWAKAADVALPVLSVPPLMLMFANPPELPFS